MWEPIILQLLILDKVFRIWQYSNYEAYFTAKVGEN